MTCHYAGRSRQKCVVGVMFTIHDKRGCVDVCMVHAKWRMTTSAMPGHSSSCTHPDNTNRRT